MERGYQAIHGPVFLHMNDPVRDLESRKMNTDNNDKVEKKFVKYKEGAALYGMGYSSFVKLAKEADAVYKISRLALVKLEVLDRYLELYHMV